MSIRKLRKLAGNGRPHDAIAQALDYAETHPIRCRIEALLIASRCCSKIGWTLDACRYAERAKGMAEAQADDKLIVVSSIQVVRALLQYGDTDRADNVLKLLQQSMDRSPEDPETGTPPLRPARSPT